ncbi:unnamed protein product, partial [Polarella glacialis]
AEDPLQSESASALLLRAQRAFRAWQGEEYLSAGGALGTVPYGPELLKLIRRLHCRQGSGDEARCSLPLENESCNPEVVQAALGLVEEWATDRRDQNDCVAEPFVVAEVVGVVAGDGNDCTLRLLEKLDQGCSTTAPSAVVLRPEGRAASQLRRQARSQGLQGRVRILGLGPSLQDVVDEGVEVAVLFVNAAPGGHLEALQSAKQLLSLGQIASFVTELQNPHFVPGASDPLDIFELLVWHGYLIAPMEDPNRPFTMVGEVQQFVGDPSGLPRLRVVARLRRRQGRRWRSPAPSSRAGCLALGAGKGERPNSWAEVDESELLRKIRQVANLVSGVPPSDGKPLASGKQRRLGAVLSSGAFGHDPVLAGQVIATSRLVQMLFVFEPGSAIQLAAALQRQRGPSSPQSVALLSQVPDRETLCALAAHGVAVAAVSMTWLDRAAGWKPCRGSRVKLHLEVQSGLGRSGFELADILSAARLVLRKSQRWQLAGVYTHTCCAQDAEMTRRSLRAFSAAVVLVEVLVRGSGRRHRRDVLQVHIGGGLGSPGEAQRSALASLPRHWMVRVGQALFGSPGPGEAFLGRLVLLKAARCLSPGRPLRAA